MIVKELKKKTLKIMDEEFEILDFSFALPYTYVLIEGERGKSLGVAMTLQEEILTNKSEFEDIDIEVFIKKVDSLNIIERTLGLAALNAVSQYYLDLSKVSREEVVEIISVENIRKIGVVGNIVPIVNILKNEGYDLYIFERNPKTYDRRNLKRHF